MADDNSTSLIDELEGAAIEAAKEIRSFLGTYRGNDKDRLNRVKVAVATVSGFTRLRASQNNLASMMLMAARQSGVPAEQQLEIAKAAGLLPAKASGASK